VPFPEYGFVNKMHDYDHFRPYLHSRDIHWSYGAMKGREDDLWQRRVAALSPHKMIDELRSAGFAGIYIDRFGYADGAEQIESLLRAYLSAEPLVSTDHRLCFYRFRR